MGREKQPKRSRVIIVDPPQETVKERMDVNDYTGRNKKSKDAIMLSEYYRNNP